MTKCYYKSCAIAIGRLVAAHEAISKAQNEIEYNFGVRYNKDLNKVWCIINGIIANLNKKLDDKIITEEE